MKDHEKRELVSELVGIASIAHGTEQLRDRIAYALSGVFSAIDGVTGRAEKAEAELARLLAAPNEIGLGKGEFVIWPVKINGVHGLAFVKTDDPKVVGTSHAEPEDGQIELGAGDSAIYFGNAESAMVLAERLQYVISLMTGSDAAPVPAVAAPAAPEECQSCKKAWATPPIAWFRKRSDGGVDGPLMDDDSRMCATRRKEWTPLYERPFVPDWANYRKGFNDGIEDVRYELKQLCKDFSDRQNRPYMGDVYAQVDAICDRALLQSATSAPASAAAPAVPEELLKCWLIERPASSEWPAIWLTITTDGRRWVSDGGTMYATGGDWYFTSAASEALKFADKESADEYVRHNKIKDVVVTEHIFDNRALLQSAPQSDKEV